MEFYPKICVTIFLRRRLLGGIVALTTKHPREHLREDRAISATFKGGYSAANQSTVKTLSLAGSTGPTSGMILYTLRTGQETANTGSEAGHGSGREQPDPQQISIDNLTAKLAYSPNPSHEFTLSTNLYSNDTDTRILSDYGSIVFGTTVNRRDAQDSRSRSHWSLSYLYTGELLFADSMQFTSYRQSSRTEQLTQEDRTTPSRAFQTRHRESLYKQEIDGAWIQIDKAFDVGSVNHMVTYGAEYYVTHNASMRNGGTLDTSGNPAREFFPLPTRDFPLTEVAQSAAFVQDELALFDDTLLLSPSLRFDRIDAVTRADEIYMSGNPGSPIPENYADSQLTAKFGAVYALSRMVSAYGRYSEGFRAPPYDDVNVGFTNFLAGYKTIANSELESERSRGVELGLRLSGEHGQAQIAVFRNNYKNFIESLAIAPQFLSSGGIDPTDGLRTFQSVNRTRAQIDGLEFSGSLALGSGLTLRAAVAHASGEERSVEAPLNSIEPLNVVLGIGYEARSDLWGADLICSTAQGKDESDIDSANPRLGVCVSEPLKGICVGRAS